MFSSTCKTSHTREILASIPRKQLSATFCNVSGPTIRQDKACAPFREQRIVKDLLPLATWISLLHPSNGGLDARPNLPAYRFVLAVNSKKHISKNEGNQLSQFGKLSWRLLARSSRLLLCPSLLAGRRFQNLYAACLPLAIAPLFGGDANFGAGGQRVVWPGPAGGRWDALVITYSRP